MKRSVSPASPSHAAESVVAPGAGTYALVILCLVGVFNYADRQVLAMLVEPIQRDLAISDTSFGILTGAGFAVVHATAAIPLAIWADRGVRRNIVALCLTIWSGMTVLCGGATSFLQLLVARAGVAVGESGAAPSIQSMLADYFPPSRRAGALGALTAAQSTGVAAGMLAGGVGVDLLGWRGVFVAVGLPGILLAILLRLTVAEPPRQRHAGRAFAAATRPTLAANIRGLWATPTYRALLGAAAASGFAGYAILSWAPAYFTRVHGVSPANLGVTLSIATVVSLVLGNLLAGSLADRLGSRRSEWYLLIPVAGCLAAWPFALAFAYAPTFALGIAAFFVMELLFTLHLAPIYAAVTLIAPSHMRGTAVMLVGAAMGLFGSSLGPLVVGILNDHFAGRGMGVDSIRASLAIAATIGMLSLAACAGLGVRRIRADLLAAQPDTREPSAAVPILET